MLQEIEMRAGYGRLRISSAVALVGDCDLPGAEPPFSWPVGEEMEEEGELTLGDCGLPGGQLHFRRPVWEQMRDEGADVLDVVRRRTI
jgi:hypothetical protein